MAASKTMVEIPLGDMNDPHTTTSSSSAGQQPKRSQPDYDDVDINCCMCCSPCTPCCLRCLRICCCQAWFPCFKEEKSSQITIPNTQPPSSPERMVYQQEMKPTVQAPAQVLLPANTASTSDTSSATTVGPLPTPAYTESGQPANAPISLAVSPDAKLDRFMKSAPPSRTATLATTLPPTRASTYDTTALPTRAPTEIVNAPPSRATTEAIAAATRAATEVEPAPPTRAATNATTASPTRASTELGTAQPTEVEAAHEEE